MADLKELLSKLDYNIKVVSIEEGCYVQYPKINNQEDIHIYMINDNGFDWTSDGYTLKNYYGEDYWINPAIFAHIKNQCQQKYIDPSILTYININEVENIRGVLQTHGNFYKENLLYACTRFTKIPTELKKLIQLLNIKGLDELEEILNDK